MAEKKWYVVNTHSGYENKAKNAMEKRIAQLGMEEKFGEVLVPVETVLENKKLKSGEQKTSTKKFFPGYILVEMILDDYSWHLVTGTPKVSGFVGGGKRPPAMPQKEIDRIKSQMEQSKETPDLVQALSQGDNVQVTDGPFSNFNGVVEEVDQDRKRIRVLVSIFGRVVPVELEFSQVERVTA